MVTREPYRRWCTNSTRYGPHHITIMYNALIYSGCISSPLLVLAKVLTTTKRIGLGRGDA